MLDKRTEAVLQILSEQAKDGYTVLQKQQLLKLLPQKYQLDTKNFCATVSFLKEQGYVDVKYQDKDSICLSVTVKAKNHLEGLGETKGAKIVSNQFGLLLLLVGACAFVGAFVATIVAKLIF